MINPHETRHDRMREINQEKRDALKWKKEFLAEIYTALPQLARRRDNGGDKTDRENVKRAIRLANDFEWFWPEAADN